MHTTVIDYRFTHARYPGRCGCGTRLAVGLPIYDHGWGWICTACHYTELGR